MTADVNVKKMLFEGYAKKEGGSIKSWKKRYIRFTDDGEISYYKDQTDAMALNSVNVTLCTGIQTDVKFSKLGFTLLTGGTRNYKFTCCTAEDCVAFVAAIKTMLPAPLVEERTSNESIVTSAEPHNVEGTPASEEAPKGEDEKSDTKAEEATEEEESEDAVEKLEDAEETNSIRSIPMTVLPLSAASRSGWLSKSGGGKISAAFQRRWIQVVGANLTYAKSNKEGTSCKGAIGLAQVQFLSLKGAVFNIGTLGRTYHFQAESAEAALDWIEHLNTIVPEGARFTETEATRNELAADDGDDVEFELVEEQAETPETEADKDELIRTLQARVADLEAQVKTLTLSQTPATKVVVEAVANATEAEEATTSAEGA